MNETKSSKGLTGGRIYVNNKPCSSIDVEYYNDYGSKIYLLVIENGSLGSVWIQANLNPVKILLLLDPMTKTNLSPEIALLPNLIQDYFVKIYSQINLFIKYETQSKRDKIIEMLRSNISYDLDYIVNEL